ncbi:Uncharacterised protein [Vibrio cholerae]|uniref:Uncharacterized protein n=1 Tax=Vibrio cholerae TaxID=666 RepID=A0A655X4A1_VIBCL|nr:Uncharacterised protein [Vibrio cholerae]CSC04846.1 Uncharacterised protein [Vibrio cholerae]CSC16923.1 Uncharacterised protein [Vibrio cholerae]CSD13483.1 Uncharacterised protein [Vibrio cholerae]CSI57132.1 Uncharacterised protein [Vibrio cholerae]
MPTTKSKAATVNSSRTPLNAMYRNSGLSRKCPPSNKAAIPPVIHRAFSQSPLLFPARIGSSANMGITAIS